MLGLVLLALVLLSAVAAWPLFTHAPGDSGDGRALVRLAPPVPTLARRSRTVAFFLLAGLLVTLWLALRHPAPVTAYATLVSRLARGVDGQPVQVDNYIRLLHPAAQFLAVCYLAALGLVVRADVGRKLMIAGQALLYLALAVLVDTVLVLAAVHYTFSPRLVTLGSLLINLLLAAVIGARVTLTTFLLPRPTAVTKTRPRYPWDSALTASCLLLAGAVLVSAYALLAPRSAASAKATSAWLPIYGVSFAVIVSFFALYLLFLLGPRQPRPAPANTPAPHLDVITPAFNEQAGITLTLESVDRAAGRYPGLVHVIVSDDGSTDRTVALAQAAIARFSHATGSVISHPNTGKALALNRALVRAEADLVVRLDGDCVLDPDALAMAVRWFTDPQVGSVGALMMPRPEGSSWFHRMRGIECLFQFGLARQGQQVVDGITVIPGTFTAVRRAPLQELGGFVHGMNGEDSDLTMQLGRLGYRMVLDPRVRCYEDVPDTVGSFLEQRTRWGRAGLHTFARHNPFRSGFAGPRTWLWTLRRPFAWVSGMLGLLGPLYVALLAILQPTYRRGVGTVIELFLLLGAAYLTVAVALIVRHRCWRLLPWVPTWYAFAFLRRLAMLEALISLPTRPGFRPLPSGGRRADAASAPAPGPVPARRPEASRPPASAPSPSPTPAPAPALAVARGRHRLPHPSVAGAVAAALALLSAGCGGSGGSAPPRATTHSIAPSPPGPSGTSTSGPGTLGESQPGGPGAANAEQWIFTHAALQQVIADPAARRRLGNGRIFEILGKSRTSTSELPVIRTLSFPSEAALAAAVAAGLPTDVRAVLYDAESWSFTPLAEQQDPARYYAAAAAAAHAHGLLLIAAPGLDLVAHRCGGPCGPHPAAFLRQGLADAAARSADVLDIQAQSLERDPATYAQLVAAAAAQARAAQPHILVVAGLSTNPPGATVSSAMLGAAIAATQAVVSGYWVNIPGRGAQCPNCNAPRPDLAIATLAGSN